MVLNEKETRTYSEIALFNLEVQVVHPQSVAIPKRLSQHIILHSRRKNEHIPLKWSLLEVFGGETAFLLTMIPRVFLVFIVVAIMNPFTDNRVSEVN